MHGAFVGRIAPSSSQRRRIEAPALVVGHPVEPVHPAADAAMRAEELPRSRCVRARSIVEWRASPGRLDAEALRLVQECWEPEDAGARGGRRTHRDRAQ